MCNYFFFYIPSFSLHSFSQSASADEVSPGVGFPCSLFDIRHEIRVFLSLTAPRCKYLLGMLCDL